MNSKLTIAAVLIVVLAMAGGAFAAGEPGAKDVMDSLYKRMETLTNYKFTFDFMDAPTKDGDGENRVVNYWFNEAPLMFKMNIAGGDDKGAKICYNEKKSPSSVRIKKGFISLSMKKSDPRISDVFGSDWKSDLAEIKGLVSGTEPKMAGGGDVRGRAAREIEFSGLKGEFDRVALWVDEKDDVLVQYEYYSGDKLRRRKTWYDYTLDAGLTDKDFK